jgi:hypothetical protein
MKYEYQTLSSGEPEVNEQQLNEMGEHGWLLVSVYERPRSNERWIYVFAREKPEEK